MNKFLYILSLLAYGYSVNSFAEDKIYISSRDVLIADNGIIVSLDGFAQSVNPIHCDENGIYLERLEAWYCRNCDKHTWSFNEKCPSCGRPKPKCGEYTEF